MTPAQSALVERVRALLVGETVREVSMFGGRSVMVDEKMIAAARKDGGLLVRVPADDHDELLRRPGATQAEMGAGRSMGPGWIEVDGDTIADDDQLAGWFEIALAHRRASAGGQ